VTGFDDEKEIINYHRSTNRTSLWSRRGICAMSHLRNVKAISSASAISYVPVCIAHAAEHVAGTLNRTVRLPRHYRVNYVCSPCQWSAIISSSAALYWILRCLVSRCRAASRFNGLYRLVGGSLAEFIVLAS